MVAKAERYGPGEEAAQFDPGDFILTHRYRPIAGLIRIAQELRFHGPDGVYAHWTHCALVVAEDGSIVEAESTGVVRSPISKYRSKEYHLVRLGTEFGPEGRRQAVAYASAQVGQAFGFLALIGATLFLITGRPFRLTRRNHQICSGLVVRALQKGGMLLDADPDLTLPADLARMYDVKPQSD
jgi:uncharacterized protein YycO